MKRTGGGDGLDLLRIEVQAREDGDWIVLEGEFDLAGVAAAERALGDLEAAGGRPIVIDLGALSFLDSSAVRTLVRATERARALGQGLTIVTGSGPAQRLFRVLGLEGRLPTIDDPTGNGP